MLRQLVFLFELKNHGLVIGLTFNQSECIYGRRIGTTLGRLKQWGDNNTLNAGLAQFLVDGYHGM